MAGTRKPEHKKSLRKPRKQTSQEHPRAMSLLGRVNNSPQIKYCDNCHYYPLSLFLKTYSELGLGIATIPLEITDAVAYKLDRFKTNNMITSLILRQWLTASAALLLGAFLYKRIRLLIQLRHIKGSPLLRVSGIPHILAIKHRLPQLVLWSQSEIWYVVPFPMSLRLYTHAYLHRHFLPVPSLPVIRPVKSMYFYQRVTYYQGKLLSSPRQSS